MFRKWIKGFFYTSFMNLSSSPPITCLFHCIISPAVQDFKSIIFRFITRAVEREIKFTCTLLLFLFCKNFTLKNTSRSKSFIHFYFGREQDLVIISSWRKREREMHTHKTYCSHERQVRKIRWKKEIIILITAVMTIIWAFREIMLYILYDFPS